MKKSVLAGLIFLLGAYGAQAKTTSSSSSGNWANSATWNNGIPVAGDVVYCQGYSVTSAVSVVSLATLATLHDDARLVLENGADIAFDNNGVFNKGVITVGSGASLSKLAGASSTYFHLPRDSGNTVEMVIDGGSVSSAKAMYLGGQSNDSDITATLTLNDGSLTVDKQLIMGGGSNLDANMFIYGGTAQMTFLKFGNTDQGQTEDVTVDGGDLILTQGDENTTLAFSGDWSSLFYESGSIVFKGVDSQSDFDAFQPVFDGWVDAGNVTSTVHSAARLKSMLRLVDNDAVLSAVYAPQITAVQGQWLLDDGSGTAAADSSGNGAGMTLDQGSAAWLTNDPIYGTGFSFDGTQRFTVPAGSFAFDMSKDFILSMTVLADASHPTATFFGRYSNEAWTSGGKVFGISDGKLNFGAYGVGNFTGTTSILDGEFHDVAVEFEAATGTLSFYLDGVLDAQTTAFGAMTTIQDNFDAHIGSHKANTDGSLYRPFSGVMRDVRIGYEAALQSPENGSEHAALSTLLTWSTLSPDHVYNVYVDTNLNNVVNATEAAPGTMHSGTGLLLNTFDPGGLDLATTYYWRVDTVDLFDNVTQGVVWSFSTYDTVEIRQAMIDYYDTGVPTLLNNQKLPGYDPVNDPNDILAGQFKDTFNCRKQEGNYLLAFVYQEPGSLYYQDATVLDHVLLSLDYTCRAQGSNGGFNEYESQGGWCGVALPNGGNNTRTTGRCSVIGFTMHSWAKCLLTLQNEPAFISALDAYIDNDGDGVADVTRRDAYTYMLDNNMNDGSMTGVISCMMNGHGEGGRPNQGIGAMAAVSDCNLAYAFLTGSAYLTEAELDANRDDVLTNDWFVPWWSSKDMGLESGHGATGYDANYGIVTMHMVGAYLKNRNDSVFQAFFDSYMDGYKYYWVMDDAWAKGAYHEYRTARRSTGAGGIPLYVAGLCQDYHPAFKMMFDKGLAIYAANPDTFKMGGLFPYQMETVRIADLLLNAVEPEASSYVLPCNDTATFTYTDSGANLEVTKTGAGPETITWKAFNWDGGTKTYTYEPPVLSPYVVVTESGGSTAVGEEGPTSDTYTIVLGTPPAADVSITVYPDGPQVEINGNGGGNSVELIFTSINWDVPQTVTVTAVDDLVDEGMHTSSLIHVASGADMGYSSSLPIDSVVVTIADNDGVIPNDPPAFSSDPVNEVNATEGAAYSSTLADDASDPESDPMTFSKVSGPAWLHVASDGTLSGTPAAGDIGANVFTVQVDAEGGSDSATLNIIVDAASAGWTQILCDNFESGWGNWIDGGSDALLHTGSHVLSGSQSADLQDNNSTSVMSTSDLNLSAQSEIKVVFDYKCVSMDKDTEDFWLQISTDGGSSYTMVEEWNRNDEFVNDQVYTGEEVIITGITLTAQTRLRFRCDASANGDDVYIDEVYVYAQ